MEYTIVKLREHLSEALGRAHHADEVIDVLHYRKPYAAVVSKDKGDLIKFMDIRLTKKDLMELTNIIDEVTKNEDYISLSKLITRYKESETEQTLRATKQEGNQGLKTAEGLEQQQGSAHDVTE